MMKKYFLKFNDRIRFILNEGTKSDQGDSSSLEKGLIMFVKDNSMCGEGVGFGVPALEYQNKIIFSTSAKINNYDKKLQKSFSIDAYHRITWMHKFLINDRFYSIISDKFKHRYQQDKKYQKFLRFFMKLITLLGFRISTEKISSKGFVDVSYEITKDNLIISVDTSRLIDKEYRKLLIFNEQSADFDLYRDEFIELRKDDIGVWEEAQCQEASLTNESAKTTFFIKKINGTKLFRGRELLEPRLDWAGFCYIIPSKVENLRYIIQVK
ncbi:hypothetical protein, partial [[Eubacterium] cellulosolvens]